MAIKSQAQLKTANDTDIQPTVTTAKHRAVNEDIIDSAINRIDDANLLGGGQAYNASSSTGYAVGNIVSYNDGGGNKVYVANKVIAPNPGAFDAADWDLVDTAGAPFEYGQTIFVDKNGNDTNNGKSPSAPVLTITKAIELVNAIITGGATQATIVVFPGTYNEGGNKAIESGVTIHGIGLPKIEGLRGEPVSEGGSVDFTLKGVDISGTGSEFYRYTVTTSSTIFNINILDCVTSWTAAAEANACVYIGSDVSGTVLNLNIVGFSGDNFAYGTVVEANANVKLTSADLVTFTGFSNSDATTTTQTLEVTGATFSNKLEFRGISSTVDNVNFTATLSGVNSAQTNGLILGTFLTGTFTVKTVAGCSFACPVASFAPAGTTYSGAGYLRGSDGDAYSPDGGFMDYNDATTATTPITLTADTWTDITNDGAGAFTNKTYAPYGVTELLDTSTGYLDFSELPLGAVAYIRKDFTITPNTNNTGVQFRYVLGTGAGEYTLETMIPRLDNGAGVEYRISLGVDMIYMGDTNTRDNPVKLQIKTDADAVLENAGIAIAIK